MWAKCGEGQSGADCSLGVPSALSWDESLQAAQQSRLAGYDDWRLPEKEELEGLVDYTSFDPAIDAVSFPATPVDGYLTWTNTTAAADPNQAWGIDFNNGESIPAIKTERHNVRLVRDEELMNAQGLTKQADVRADIQLTNGVALNGQSVAYHAWKYYSIVVPSGTTNLTLKTTNATADVDIYTQFGVKPTFTSWICKQASSLFNETCSVPNPTAGIWWLGVYGYTAASFTVTGTHFKTLLSDGFETGTGWNTIGGNNHGTYATWTQTTSSLNPTTFPHSGSKLAKFNSYSADSGNSAVIYRTSTFMFPGNRQKFTLTFWMYRDSGYPSKNDRIQIRLYLPFVQSSYISIGAEIPRYAPTSGWTQITRDLPGGYQNKNATLGFAGISAHGNNITIDDVTVTAQ